MIAYNSLNAIKLAHPNKQKAVKKQLPKVT